MPSVRKVPEGAAKSRDADWSPMEPSTFTITTAPREKGDPGYFVRKFAIDDSINGNKWAVTPPSIKNCMSTFVDCPVVLVPGDMTHPVPQIQEAYRVGEIVGTRVLEDGRYGEDTIRLDESVASLVYNGAIKYTSVQISYLDSDAEIAAAGTAFEHVLIHRWVGRHDALVGEPAYGRDKAVMRHICKGTESECKRRLPSSLAKADLSDTTVGQVTIVPFIEKVVSSIYTPCTIDRIVSKASMDEKSTIAKVRSAGRSLTNSQVLAIAMAPEVAAAMGRPIVGIISQAMADLDRA